jgi:hypothetical protein
MVKMKQCSVRSVGTAMGLAVFVTGPWGGRVGVGWLIALIFINYGVHIINHIYNISNIYRSVGCERSVGPPKLIQDFTERQGGWVVGVGLKVLNGIQLSFADLVGLGIFSVYEFPVSRSVGLMGKGEVEL